VRDRGPRTRRSSTGRIDPGYPPPPRSGVNAWQALAIVALIAATAGWTTAIVLATRQADVAVASASIPDDTSIPSDNGSTEPPVADTHDAPELEALLPTTLQNTPLQLQSWTGSGILTDDDWSNSFNAFLTANGKGPADLTEAQAYDPTQALDGSIGVYRVKGVDPAKVRDALIAAWKADGTDAPTSTVTIGGKEMTKVDFPQDTPDSYIYLRDDVVFDIESMTPSVVEEALASLPKPGSTARPIPSSSATPAATTVPSAS
jgi:hypothetical protein